jgi:sugar/nucleoside kinase (ribokinase family)
LGTDVVFATYVGVDELGQLVANALVRRGLHGPTTLVCESQPRAVVLYDSAGRRSSATDLRSTPDLRYPVSVFESALDESACDAVVLTNIGFTRPLLPVAAARGIPIATDLHLVAEFDRRYDRAWMAAADTLACSHERLPCLPEEWIRTMWRRHGTPLVLVGCGSDGAVVGVRATHRIWHVESATPRGVRYTSGAGDTLLGSFVHHHVTLGDPVAAARHAVLTAGWKVGGTPDDDPGVPAARIRDLVRHRGLPSVMRLA